MGKVKLGGVLSSHLQCPGAGTVGFNPLGWRPDSWNTRMLEKTALSVAKLLKEMLFVVVYFLLSGSHAAPAVLWVYFQWECSELRPEKKWVLNALLHFISIKYNWALV